jgi:hypothetical protein
VTKTCKCGKSFKAYNTIQKECGDCTVAKIRDRAAEKRKQDEGKNRFRFPGTVQHGGLGKERGDRKGNVDHGQDEKGRHGEHKQKNDTKGHVDVGGKRANALGRTVKACRSNGIAKESDKQKKDNAKLAAIKAKKIKEMGSECESCGQTGALDLSHLAPKSTFPEHKTNERLLVLHGSERYGTCYCHTNWESNNYKEIAKFKNFHEIMLRIREMDEGYYWVLVHKFKEQKLNNHKR